MPEPDESITHCSSCENAMDVSAVAPFSNVECPTCGERNRVKTEFGHYTLTRRLAEGGMSLVFVAMDNTLGREVALKILNEDYSADERRIKAFEEEARITASFSHPNVVRVFTTGRAFGRFYIAMELVPGGHFEHQIRERGIIPEIEILPFAVQVAEGLEAARAAGLIHRDIKPGNILLDAQDNAKIVDFGLALVTKGGSATAQEIWATPYYVPPETIEGHAEDFRSDLYAFGATLYHALAGVPSCDEKSMATDVLRQAKKHVKALRFAAPNVSEETCAIVDRAMAYDRNARFGSYEEMILQLKAALGRLKKGGGTSAGRLKKRGGVSRGEWIAIGAAALVLLIAAAAGLAWIGREEPKKVSVETVVLETPEIAEDQGRGALIAQRYREARDAVESGRYEKARATFAALRDDREVQEPTRTWAAVEAVVVTFLDGRPIDARIEAELAIRHITNADLEEKKLRTRLLDSVKAVDSLEAARPEKSDESNDDAAWTLGMMLRGLKNWEQGMTGQAAEAFFKPVASSELRARDQWVKSYHKIAKSYLADNQLLNDPVFDSLPQDPAACRKASDHLEGLLKKVRTRGRVRFNMKAWEADIARHMKLLERPAIQQPAGGSQGSAPDAVPLPAPADPWVKINELSKACRFAEAVELIKSLPADPPGATRESLILIHTSADHFLRILEEELGRGTAEAPLRSRSGETLEQITSGKPGVLVHGARELGWGDVDPESAIQFYRASARTRMQDVDQLQRHECAIAYDWLIGDRNRAILAADRLATESYLFKRRWSVIVSGLPK